MSVSSRLALIAVLLASSLGAPAASVVLAQAPASPTPFSALARLGGQPCPNDSVFTCITLTVPLDHFNPSDSRTIKVIFALLPATGRRQGMFVTATGGPGTSGLAAADSYTAAFDPQIPRHFDIVFFDQRGMGLSGGLTCPQAAAVYYQADGRAKTPQQEAALKNAAQTFSAACVNELSHPEWLPYLGTRQAVEDLEQFRKLIGDDKFWLYGESYGTQYAQTYAAGHGSHLAGLILDGTVDLTLDGFKFYAQQAQAFSDTLLASLRACNDDQACRADMHSSAVAAYDDLAAQLDHHPLPFDFPLPQGGQGHRQFTFADLEVVAGGQVYSEGDRMLFNRALAAYGARHDLAPLARLLYLSLGLDPQTLAAVPDPTYSDAIYYGVECQDYAYPGAAPPKRADNFMRAGDPVEASVPRLGSFFYGDLPCAYWPHPSTDLSRPKYLQAKGVTTLVLGATADPATPLSNGLSVYQHLSDSYLIVQQGGPHVIFGRGNACPDDLVTAFLVKGQVPNQRETSCDGSLTDDYVALSPAAAAAFDTPLAALASAETEIYYLSEYYYWDYVTPTSAGCPFGGTFAFAPNGAKTDLTFSACAFAKGVILTGAGAYTPNNDRFTFDVSLAGRWQCTLKYVRTGDHTKVTGTCDGKKVSWDA